MLLRMCALHRLRLRLRLRLRRGFAAGRATSCSACISGNGVGHGLALFRVNVKMFTALVIEEFGAQALRKNLAQTAGDMPPGLPLPKLPG